MADTDKLVNEFSIMAAPYDAASKKKQQQWGMFPEAKKQQLRKTNKDTDKDGVPDIWDCQPRNPFRQDRFSETQLAEINGLGPIEVKDFIGRGGFGAVYNIKSKDPSKQDIADKYVVKVGLDAFSARERGTLSPKEKKLLNFWESTEGHKPTLERLHKKTGKSGSSDMEALDEYKEYKDKGFEDLTLMIPSKPTTVEMGDFKTFAILKPKVKVAGERLNRIPFPERITPEILDQLREGTLEFSGAKQGIWDYMQFGIGDKDGEQKAWIFDTGVVRDSSDAHAMNETTWRGFAKAVNEKSPGLNVNPVLGPAPGISMSSTPTVPEDDLAELADWVDNKWGWPPWDVVEETKDKLKYSRKRNIIGDDGQTLDGKYVLIVGKAPFGGSGWSLDVYHNKIMTVIFHHTFLTAKEAVVAMHKIAQTIELTTSTQNQEQVRAISNQIVDNLNGKVNLKTVKNKAGSRKVKGSGPIWGKDWGKWKVNNDHESGDFLQLTWNGIYSLAIYETGGEWRVSFRDGADSLAMQEYPTKQKALKAAYALSQSSIIEKDQPRQDLEMDAQFILDEQKAKSTSKKTPSVPSKPVWGQPWGKWKVDMDDRSGNFLIMQNEPYLLAVYEAGDWTVSLQVKNKELANRHYPTEEEALGAAFRLSQAKMFNKSNPEFVKEKAEAILDLNGRAISKAGSPKNIAMGRDWGSWNIHTDNPAKLILTYDVAGYAFHYKISVGKDNNHLRVVKVWPEATEELYSGFPGGDAVTVAHALARVVEQPNSKSVAGTDQRMLEVIDKFERGSLQAPLSPLEMIKSSPSKKAGWVEKTAPVSEIMQFNKFHDEAGNTKAWLAVDEPVPGRFAMQFVAKGNSGMSDKIRARGNINLMSGREVDKALDEILGQNSLHGGFSRGAGFATVHRLGVVQDRLTIPANIISGPNVFHVVKQEGSNGTVWYFFDKEGTKYSLTVRKYGYGGVNKGYKVYFSTVVPHNVLFDRDIATAEGTIKAVKELIHRHNIGAVITDSY